MLPGTDTAAFCDLCWKRPVKLSPAGVSCDIGHPLSLSLPTPRFRKKGHWLSLDILTPAVGSRRKLICSPQPPKSNTLVCKLLEAKSGCFLSWQAIVFFLFKKKCIISLLLKWFFCHFCSVCPLCGALSASFWDLPLWVYSPLLQGLSTWTDTVHCVVSDIRDMPLVLTLQAQVM